MRIGVLALQGDIPEHTRALLRCGCSVVEVKAIGDLGGLEGLILPGGESTTQGNLLVKFGLLEPIAEAARQGLAVWGTCAGMILMAKEIPGFDQPHLALMDIVVRRNAFGRQIDSFEAPVEIRGLEGGPFPAVFIRAPYIEKAGTGVEVLAEFEGKPVLVQEGRLLASAFHPEMTDDVRMHRYFLEMVREETPKSQPPG